MKSWRRGAAAAALVGAAACTGPQSSRSDAPAGAASPTQAWFTEEARAAGVDFVHFNGMSGEFYYPEMFGAGVGLLDADNDGDLDLYVTQGQMLGPGRRAADAVYPPRGELRDRLFRNDLAVGTDGTRMLRFTDITDRSGVDVRTYGMGVASGDFDNDGWTDIYRTGVDRGVLLRNHGGTFADVTAASGTANAGSWGVSASFVDYDRDGWLDLFIGNYVEYRMDRESDCFSVTGRPDYCPPAKYPPQLDRLYRNRGDGTFEDVTRRALAGGAHGPALGVSSADFNGDGWPDIYVGNDGAPNQLWINQRDGTFEDSAFRTGAAVSGAGASEASMGIDAGDFDNDGDDDLFITNWLSQMNTIYVNDGGVFEDRKGPSGLGAPSLAKTGFGTGWFDYDNDGWLDLLTINGSVAIIDAQARSGDPFPYRMTKQLYRNLANGRFEDATSRAGSSFGIAQVGRGAAFGDLDNDGDIDVVVGNDAGPLELLINRVGDEARRAPSAGNRWIGLRVVESAGRDALGAYVTIETAEGMTVHRRVRADGSYASANDPRVLAGLGRSSPVRVRVKWPDGSTEEWPDLPVNAWTTLARGKGR
jgi:hypothetical protein